MKNKINIIVALARSYAMGRGGDLLFHLSPDLKHFKQTTMGCPVVMGRKTFESLPGGPLPGRRNIIVTRNADYKVDGADTFPDIESAISAAAEAADTPVFIIGGGEIYRQTIGIADALYLTEIDADAPDADTFFPEIDMSQWIEAESTPTMHDEKSGLDYRFRTLVRKN